VGTLTGPREACGVFGVYAPGRNVANLTFFGLFALQHRGQESAGIAVSDGRRMIVQKDMGLVSQVFDESRLAPLEGHIATGHVRYSTTGSSTWENAQPAYRHTGRTGIALGHNGNLTNITELAESLPPGAVMSSSDSDIIAGLLLEAYRESDDGPLPPPLQASLPAQPPEKGAGALERALTEVLPRLRGAFSLVVMDDRCLAGVRDPLGFRPLVLGRLPGSGWVIASETCALDMVGAHFVREIEPGEMVVVADGELRSSHPMGSPLPSLCLFEFVYFARPDSRLFGQGVHAARQRMGELLAEQAPAAADMVMPIPESGVPAAQGYARASGIPYGDGLVKNRYVGRTFIEPTQILRDQGIRLKLNPLIDNIRGKRLVVVDDSIVRGSTQRQIVAILREAGASEVHVRISSPPYRWPCFFGMDTYNRSELLAAHLSVGEVCDFIGADSLAYLDIDALKQATGVPASAFCDACFSGGYRVDVDVHQDRNILEPLPFPE
jgi:amidophosphoribosyltransferase